jgi:DNA-binding transcriptional MerR regulator
MTRGELSKRTGVSTATIRYYEENNILPPPKRSSNGYRVYTEDYLIKIKFIKSAKSLGYSLKEIRETLEMLSKEMEPDSLKGIVNNKIKEIEKKIKSLLSIQNMLLNFLKTSDEEIKDYIKSFHVTEKNKQ